MLWRIYCYCYVFYKEHLPRTLPSNGSQGTLQLRETRLRMKRRNRQLTICQLSPNPHPLVPLSRIKRSFKDQPPSHHRIRKTYAGYSEKRDENQVKSRADATLLAQLRAGHSRHLRAYASLMDPSVNPNCPSCEEEAHTLEHWLDCQSTLALRQELFGETETRLEWLSEEPALSLTLAKKTLLDVRR